MEGREGPTIMKRDAVGRVSYTAQQREALLDEHPLRKIAAVLDLSFVRAVVAAQLLGSAGMWGKARW